MERSERGREGGQRSLAAASLTCRTIPPFSVKDRNFPVSQLKSAIVASLSLTNLLALNGLNPGGGQGLLVSIIASAGCSASFFALSLAPHT